MSKYFEFEIEHPHEMRRLIPTCFLCFSKGLKTIGELVREDLRIGSIIEVFECSGRERYLVFRIERRPEGDLVSDFREHPLNEKFEYRFNFKNLSLYERRNK